MAINYEPIKEEYESTSMTVKELADKHGVNLSTLKSKISRDKWKRNKDIQKIKKSPRNEKKRVASKKVATVKQEVAKKVAKKDEPEVKGLKEWEWSFCYEYVRTHNATRSYLAAKDATYATAATEGAKLLRKPHVRAVIREIKDNMYADSLVRVADIKHQLERIIFADYNDLVRYGSDERIYLDEATGMPLEDDKGERMTYITSHLSFKDMDRIDGTIIQEVRMGKDGPVIKPYDKVKAMQLWLTLVGQDAGPTERELRLMKMHAELDLVKSNALKAKIENGEIEPEEAGDDGFIEALGVVAEDEAVWDEVEGSDD